MEAKYSSQMTELIRTLFYPERMQALQRPSDVSAPGAAGTLSGISADAPLHHRRRPVPRRNRRLLQQADPRRQSESHVRWENS